jgi:hypothetical protein
MKLLFFYKYIQRLLADGSENIGSKHSLNASFISSLCVNHQMV